MYLDHNILDQLSDPAINLDQNFFIKILLDSLKKIQFLILVTQNYDY